MSAVGGGVGPSSRKIPVSIHKGADFKVQNSLDIHTKLVITLQKNGMDGTHRAWLVGLLFIIHACAAMFIFHKDWRIQGFGAVFKRKFSRFLKQ